MAVTGLPVPAGCAIFQKYNCMDGVWSRDIQPTACRWRQWGGEAEGRSRGGSDGGVLPLVVWKGEGGRQRTLAEAVCTLAPKRSGSHKTEPWRQTDQQGTTVTQDGAGMSGDWIVSERRRNIQRLEKGDWTDFHFKTIILTIRKQIRKKGRKKTPRGEWIRCL